jgi:SAM-dependent methyltransferase
MMARLRQLAWQARMHLPAPAKVVLRSVAERADPLAVALWRRRHGHPDPLPPRSLRASVGGAPIAMYVENGRQNVAGLSAALARVGRRLEDAERVLDFGCGSGRTLQALPRVPGQEVHGCDVNEPAVRWAREHIPSVRFEHSGFEPPLPYPDESFDVVYSISVLTHLDEPDQGRWVEEVRRVLKPGGRFVAAEPDSAGVRTDHPDDPEAMALIAAQDLVQVRQPAIGLELNRRMARAGFVERHIEVFTQIDPDYNPVAAAGDRQAAEELVAAGKLDRDRAEAAIRSLEEASARGEYAWIASMVVALGRVSSA